jgi:clorobiocin biosynthesis protein CloN6
VMIDLHWYEHAYGALDTARVCRKTLPGAWIILGGLTASAYARDILESFADIDVVIRGDAEKPLLAAVQRVLDMERRTATVPFSAVPNLSYRVDGQVVENALGYCATSADLDHLNFVDMDWLDHAPRYGVQQYVVPGPIAGLDPSTLGQGHFLCIARGCHNECAFCGGCRSAHESLAGRTDVVACSPAKVAADLARLQLQGIAQASLTFDLVELGEGYWSDLFAAMGERRVGIGLYNEFFQLADSAFVSGFAKHASPVHSCLALSPLSGCEKVRRLNGKRFGDDEFWHTLSLCKARDLPMTVYFSMNLPGETGETFEETLNLAQRIYDYYPHPRLKLLCTSHTVDPLSPMSRYPDKYGVEVNMTSFQDYYNYCRATRQPGPDARTELHRGFQLAHPEARSLEAMAARWDALAQGREANWLPIPPTW